MKIPDTIKPIGGVVFDRWQAWADLRERFLEALDGCCGTHSEDDILARIATGEYQIWRIDRRTRRAGLVTSFVQFPRLKALNVLLAAGDLEIMPIFEPYVTAWAMAQGCSRLYCGGRDGWLRLCEGAQTVGTVMYKEI